MGTERHPSIEPPHPGDLLGEIVIPATGTQRRAPTGGGGRDAKAPPAR